MKNIKTVYIHIPFCNYICTYCDFTKKYVKNQNIDIYLQHLDKEIASYIVAKQKIKTLYIGGGTPSVLNVEQIKNLAAIINKYFILDPVYEFTFEMNPDDVTAEKLALLQAIGVNRLSMGCQTTNDQLLTKIKREHSKNDVIKALELTTKYQLAVNVDFIFGLPQQQQTDIQNDLQFIANYRDYIDHVSYYSLIIEENTILSKASDFYLLEEDEANMYQLIQTELEGLGYQQYEISNYAKNNQQSMHNKVYWNNEEYFGFGLGASGYIAGLRYTNTKSLQNYYEFKNYYYQEEITEIEKLKEQLMLNLRTVEGIEKSCVASLNLDFTGFEETPTHYRIPKDKFFLANEFVVSLLKQL